MAWYWIIALNVYIAIGYYMAGMWFNEDGENGYHFLVAIGIIGLFWPILLAVILIAHLIAYLKESSVWDRFWRWFQFRRRYREHRENRERMRERLNRTFTPQPESEEYEFDGDNDDRLERMGYGDVWRTD